MFYILCSAWSFISYDTNMSTFVCLSWSPHHVFMRDLNAWVWVFKYISNNQVLYGLFMVILHWTHRSYLRWEIVKKVKMMHKPVYSLYVSFFFLFLLLLVYRQWKPMRNPVQSLNSPLLRRVANIYLLISPVTNLQISRPLRWWMWLTNMKIYN